MLQRGKVAAGGDAGIRAADATKGKPSAEASGRGGGVEAPRARSKSDKEGVAWEGRAEYGVGREARGSYDGVRPSTSKNGGKPITVCGGFFPEVILFWSDPAGKGPWSS